MRQIRDAFPPLDELLNLEPEEIAVFLLDYLCEIESEYSSRGQLNRYSFTLDSNMRNYAGDKANEVATMVSVLDIRH